MELKDLFSKDLIFSLQVDSQEELFDKVADLLESKKIVTPSYKNAQINSKIFYMLGCFFCRHRAAARVERTKRRKEY